VGVGGWRVLLSSGQHTSLLLLSLVACFAAGLQLPVAMQAQMLRLSMTEAPGKQCKQCQYFGRLSRALICQISDSAVGKNSSLRKSGGSQYKPLQELTALEGQARSALAEC